MLSETGHPCKSIYISKLECGRVSLSFDNAFAIARVLEISLDSIQAGTPESDESRIARVTKMHIANELRSIINKLEARASGE
jgi:transcriptional regulator with XRE-family HTH domain